MSAPASRRTSAPRGGDPVPEDVVARARAAYARRATDPVVELVFDSADVEEPGSERLLRFERRGAVSVELWVGSEGDRRTLRGRVVPPVERVELELEDAGIRLAESAATGVFSFDGVPRGVMRLRLASRDATLLTAWFLA